MARAASEMRLSQGHPKVCYHTFSIKPTNRVDQFLLVHENHVIDKFTNGMHVIRVRCARR